MNYPLNDPELTITQKSAPLWATWVITLGILIGVMTTAGNFVPQAAKKILLYPLAIFVLAGIVSHYLALMCLVPVTRFQLTLLMCCILVGYVGQQYFSYQIYLAHQQRSAKPELINLLPAIKDDALASPEQRELKKRLEQEFNPGISDFFNWKYSFVFLIRQRICIWNA